MGLDIPATSGWAFDAYEAVRERLPPMGAGGACAQVSDLEAIAHDFDVILLDGFGVLNVGESAIPGALGRIQSLRKAGKTLLVVTNAAGYPKRFLLERYRRIGFDFALANIVSSREAMLLALRAQPERLWGVMAEERYGDEELDWCRTRILGDALADYDAVGGFLLLGSGSWTGERQQFLETSLARHPRPVLVGNPDIVAPRENGLSREPGYFAHRVADRTDTQPAFFGKPFSGVFD
ncbi:MAG: HAD-IIA family hydrolase, partial [Paracoccaceae bacterium]